MARGRQLGQYLGLLLCLGYLGLGYPAAVGATNWYLVVDTHQGEQQFVDPDSLQPIKTGQVSIRSYYRDARQGEPQITTYRTEYDCLHQRFRDVDYQGRVGSSVWQSVAADPLNAAVMVYTCEKAGYATEAIPAAKPSTD
jgi:hypothetical protein